MASGRLKAYSIVIFTLVVVVLIVLFWSSIVGITGHFSAVPSEKPINTNIKDIVDNFEGFRNKDVIIEATVSSEKTGIFSKIVDSKGNEFLINMDLTPGEYEITGKVRKQSSLYYRYYRIDYYIDVNSYEKI